MTKGGYKNHLTLHKDEKKFICEICSTAFSTKFNLNVHRMTHTEDGKKFECTVY